MAIQIRERHGGTVTVDHHGPAQGAGILRDVAWRGVDKVILLTDRQVAGADTLATSLVLQKAIEKIGRLRLGPRWAPGDRRRLRPGRSADGREAGHPPDHLRGVRPGDRRRPDHRPARPGTGSEIVRCQMPCLLDVVGSANTPRPPSVRRQIAGKAGRDPGEYAALSNEMGPSSRPTRRWRPTWTPTACGSRSGPRTTSVPARRSSALPARPPRSTRSTSWSSRAPRARRSRPLPRPSRRWWRSWSTSTSSGRRP